MTIDPSIILGLKAPAPVTFADPLENYSKGLTVKALMGQGQLQDLQVQQAQQAQKDDATLRSLTSQANGDPTALSKLLYQNGMPKQAMAIEQQLLGNQKTKAEVGKLGAETGKITSDTVGSTLKNYQSIVPTLNTPQAIAGWYKAQYDDPTIGPFLRSQMPIESALAHVPQDPAGIAAWQQNAGLNMEQAIQHKDRIASLAEEARAHDLTYKVGMTNAGIAGGNLALSRERFNFEKNQPQGQVLADQGVIVDKRTGVATPITVGGQPMTQGGKLTESQGKAAGMGFRAAEADKILRKLESSGVTTPSIIKQGVESVPLVGGALGMAANKTVASANQQKVEQAQRNFVNAALRVESGASISQSEFDNARKQYFPQPGDSAEVIAQKQQNRADAIKALSIQSGPGAKEFKIPTGNMSTGKVGGVLTPNADGSYNYGSQ